MCFVLTILSNIDPNIIYVIRFYTKWLNPLWRIIGVNNLQIWPEYRSLYGFLSNFDKSVPFGPRKLVLLMPPYPNEAKKVIINVTQSIMEIIIIKLRRVKPGQKVYLNICVKVSFLGSIIGRSFLYQARRNTGISPFRWSLISSFSSSYG